MPMEADVQTVQKHYTVMAVYLMCIYVIGFIIFFNVVTSVQDDPHAVLVRAIEPLIGKEIMELRRNMSASKPSISAGPGSAAKH